MPLFTSSTSIIMCAVALGEPLGRRRPCAEVQRGCKGDQIISFDQGETWQLPPRGPIDRSVSNVVIGWVKVTE